MEVVSLLLPSLRASGYGGTFEECFKVSVVHKHGDCMMSAKRLNRLDISSDLKDRLARNGLSSCADVLKKSVLELMRLSGCCGLTVQNLISECCLSQAVAPVTALDMLELRENGGSFLATSLPDLDKVLHGGFPAGTITELAGPAGCGKTQLSMTLSVLATLSTELGGLGGGVLYIDTEGAFSAKRLLEIGRCRLPLQFYDDVQLQQLANQIHVVFVQSCKDLMARLQNIEEDIICKKIKLVVVDSVASLVRKEYSNIKGGMIHRTDFLAAEAAVLKYTAEAFGIPVLVTNQITTRYGQQAPSSFQHTHDDVDSTVEADGEGSYLTAALGNTWSHCVNTRLILQFLPGDRRQVLVAKSPVAPFTCFDYIITEKGVEQDAQGQGHYVGTDPGKQAIRGREALSVASTQW